MSGLGYEEARDFLLDVEERAAAAFGIHVYKYTCVYIYI